MEKFIFKNETYKIIGAAMEVHKVLGCGFLEAVYQEAFEIELVKQGIPFEREKKLNIFYKDVKLQKEYYADFYCYDGIIVELKAQKELNGVHEAQLLNYMTATDTKVGLLINFGQNSLEYKRMVK